MYAAIANGASPQDPLVIPLEQAESVEATISENFGHIHNPLNGKHDSSHHAHSHSQKVNESKSFEKFWANARKSNARNKSLSGCGDHGMDGEGCAELVNTEYLEAGTNVTFTIRFTAGETGIPIGGGISVGVHHASSWPTQVISPQGSGYVKIGSENAQNFSVEHHIWAPDGMLSKISPAQNSDWIFHNVVIAKVLNHSILPGETVDFVFGANENLLRTQRYVDPDHEFRVTTDIDGDGVYGGISESPKVAVVHSIANAFSATAPSQAVVGQPFEVLVRVEDSNYNIVKSYQGFVKLIDENGRVVETSIQLVNGIGRGEVTLTSTGPHRLRIASDSDNLSGRSNPIRVFQNAPKKGLYWADLHGHTGVSDGLGKDAVEYFEFGRAVAGLDIIALTDHGYRDWPANIQAVKDFYDPGEYVTILALEGGGPSSHTNLYYRQDDADHILGWPANYPSLLDTALNQYNSDPDNPGVMAAPHHFTYDVGTNGEHLYPFEQWDGRVARFVEVYSSHGTNEFKGNPRPLGNPTSNPSKYMQGGLAAGLKFGVIGASDNHDSRPGRSIWGRYPNGLAAVWADELTRDDVWDALWNRSTYGTSIDRIYMEFNLNQQPMGAEVTTQSSVNVSAYIIGKTDVLSAVLIKNNKEIRSYDTTNGVIEISYSEVPGDGEHYYYLRVTQDNGERAWSTPIWVDASGVSQNPTDSSLVTTITLPSSSGAVLERGVARFEGTAIDHTEADVTNVLVVIRNSDEHKWVNVEGEVVNWLEIEATLAGDNAGETLWNLPINLPAGNYRVFARGVNQYGDYAIDSLGNPGWVSKPVTVVETLLVDETTPTITFTTPHSNHQVIANTTILSGHVTDTGGSGIRDVTVALYNSSTGDWVRTDGSAVNWQTYSASLVFSSGDFASWSLPVSVPAGNYRLFARAIDYAGNVALDSVGNTQWQSIPFTVASVSDNAYIAPVTTFTVPAYTHQKIAGDISFEGLVSSAGGPGVKEVLVAIYSSGLGQWVSDTGRAVGWKTYFASLDRNSPGTVKWKLPINLPAGNYHVFAIGFDYEDNVLRDVSGNLDWTSLPFIVDGNL